jgi:tRNA threonylcarbamoyladenosine biosynthesis protein TsaE
MSRVLLDLLHLPDSGATDILGRALAGALPDAASAGAVLHLQGDLGAGKTCVARSLLQSLGVAGKVRSPTYTLVDTYVLTRLTCVHIDLYRVQSVGEVEELGLRDLIGPHNLMLIEWPEKGGYAVPPADLAISLAYAGSARTALLEPRSSIGSDWLEKLLNDTSLSPYVSNLT